MQEQETQVTPISDAAKQPPKLSEKEQKKLDRNMEKLKEQSQEFYGFFRMGGALNLVQYRAMGEIDRAAVSLARSKIREEDAKFSMKCMMAVFNNAIEKLTGKENETQALVEVPKKSEEEVVVSAVLDTLMKPQDPRVVVVNEPGCELGSMAGDKA